MADQSDKPPLAKPRLVVGLDFGTTYSGFAFAHVSDPDKIYTYYDYPKAGGEKPYCKTLTACYYKALAPASSGAEKGRWQLHSWGYPARTDHERDIQALHKYLKSQNPTNSAPYEKKPTSSSSAHGVEKFFSRFKMFNSRNASTSAPSIQPGTNDPPPQPPSVGVFLSRFSALQCGQV